MKNKPHDEILNRNPSWEIKFRLIKLKHASWSNNLAVIYMIFFIKNTLYNYNKKIDDRLSLRVIYFLT